MHDYISKIRTKIGSDKLIHPGARIIVENEQKEILFIERVDNGQLGIPAGALEENETIEACIIREVKEETGIEIISLEVIGISSNPETETVQYPNGDKIQYFTIEFYSNHWKGHLKVNDATEIKNAAFKDRRFLNNLPANEQSIIESLEHYRDKQKVKLK